MGLPIKISEALALAARTEAGVLECSIASRVEHWAQIGRAVELLVRQVEDLLAQYGHARFTTDASKYRPTAGARATAA